MINELKNCETKRNHKKEIKQMMKKKYQVFISSTYKDLIDERAAVLQCLLDMGCIPVGMEQYRDP